MQTVNRYKTKTLEMGVLSILCHARPLQHVYWANLVPPRFNVPLKEKIQTHKPGLIAPNLNCEIVSPEAWGEKCKFTAYACTF